MSPQLSQLTDQVLSLNEDDRLILAHTLWKSLEPTAEELELDEELIAEIERRDAEIESGAVETVSHEEVMRKLRKIVGK
jgi:putative addiction module component (TIGR02574 family)